MNFAVVLGIYWTGDWSVCGENPKFSSRIRVGVWARVNTLYRVSRSRNLILSSSGKTQRLSSARRR